MKKLKALLKRLFCLPPLPAVLLAVFGYGSVILVFALEIQTPAPRYAAYLASAYALAVTAAWLPRLLKKGKEKVSGHALVRKLRSSPAGEERSFRTRAWPETFSLPFFSRRGSQAAVTARA